MMNLDPFYPIVDSTEWLKRLVPLGIRLVQLRIKTTPDTDAERDTLLQDIRLAKTICERHHCQLVVNDHWALAIEAGCDFVHLGQEDLFTADVNAIKAAGMHLGVSTHGKAELEKALSTEPAYIALGPVYPTILKKMPWQPQGVERVAQWKQQVGTIPLVAIGGLTTERAAGVFEAGADIVSLVTDITLNDNPEARVREWLAVTQPYRTTSSTV